MPTEKKTTIRFALYYSATYCRANITIGGWQDGMWFNGRIDEIYISEKGLSQEEIKAFFNGIAAVSPVYPQNKFAVAWGAIKQ